MEVVFHIGVYKTGTTSLQNGYFSKNPGIQFLGRPFKDQDVALWIKGLYQKDSMNYTDCGTPDSIRTADTTPILQNNPKYLIISDEALTAHGVADRGLIAQRLKEAAPRAKIILVLREQSDLLISYYYYMSRGRKHLQFRDFNDWFEYCGRYFNKEIFSTLNFYNLFCIYADTFGADNLCVLLYEDLKSDTAAFYSTIDSWLGLPQRGWNVSVKNVRVPQRHYMWNKLRGKLLPDVRLRPLLPSFVGDKFDRYINSGSKDQGVEYTETQMDFLRKTYGRQNTLLANATGIDLAKHGYLVTDV